MTSSDSTTGHQFRPGEFAAELEARNQFGESVQLSSTAGSPALVMFYPFAFSSVCSAELTQIINRWDEITTLGATVLAVSCDPMFALRAYAEHLKAPAGLHLLSDFWPHGHNAQRWGVFNRDRGSATRTGFVLDRHLVIQEISEVDVAVSRDINHMIRSLQDHW